MRAARQPLEHRPPASAAVGRFAEHLAVEHDGRVGRQHGPRVAAARAARQRPWPSRRRDASRTLRATRPRGAPPRSRPAAPEPHADLAQQLAAPGRRGCEVDEILAHSINYTRSLGAGIARARGAAGRPRRSRRAESALRGGALTRLRAVIGVVLEDRPSAVERFGDEHAHEPVRQRQAGQRPALGGALQAGRAQTVGAADE